jgi:hypothetical protein
LPVVIVAIGSSALKHGYTEHDIRFALEHAHIERQVVDDDPPRTWHESGDPLHEGAPARIGQGPARERR